MAYQKRYNYFSLIPLFTVAISGNVQAHDDDIEEVVVVSSRTDRSLADTPMRVQVLGQGELTEKANMKPGDIRMMLNESTGIQVQQTSATSFSSNIKIQGLDGRYTQVLRDGLPIYSGFSGSLSLLQIAPLDLEQVEVVKGSSSTLYGGGAIAGMINLVSKRPTHDAESLFMANVTSAEGTDLSYFHSNEVGKHGYTAFVSYNRGKEYAAGDEDFSAIPNFDRITFTPRWFYELSEATTFDLGVSYTEEERLGGSMQYLAGSAPNEYFERNESERSHVRFGLEHRLANGSEIQVKGASSRFDRTLSSQQSSFGGVQTSNFIEATVNGELNLANWVVGVNGTSDQFDQRSTQGYSHDYEEQVAGVFGQYTADLSESIVIEGGLRIDHHSDYGNFVLPRFSILLLPFDDFSVRLGGGLGYKTPDIFVSDAEETFFETLVPLNPDLFEAEESKGINLDFTYRWEPSHDFNITSNFLLFYTDIDNPISVAEQNGEYQFVQSSGSIDTRGVETNLVFSFEGFRYIFGHTYVDAQEHNEMGSFDLELVAHHRVNNVLVWEREDNFRIGLEAYYFSEQDRFNDNQGRDYWIFGLMTEKYINESLTAFLNFENFTDTRQTRFEQINRGDLVNPDFRGIYAPLDGFVINGGVRLRW